MRLKFYKEVSLPGATVPWCVDKHVRGRTWTSGEWPVSTNIGRRDNYTYYASTRRLMYSLREWCK